MHPTFTRSRGTGPTRDKPVASMFTTGVPFVVIAVAIASAATPAHADRDAVKSAKSWSYQLAGDMRSTARANSDVAVVDPDHTGSPTRLKTKANGGKRAVLAYISIGEVEDGRAYMKSSEAKRWSTGQSQGWKGNYAARYWDDGWKSLVKSRVRKALAAGYDGVYLDRVDTYERVKAPNGGRSEMISLVKEVAAEARATRGNAAVIVQNGEELLTDKSYVAAIDGVAKESLYYGVRGTGVRNNDGDIRESKKLLKNAKDQGKVVYVVEYLSGESSRKAKSETARDGYVGNTTASRSLEKVHSDDD